jgi:hypothetical protein
MHDPALDIPVRYERRQPASTRLVHGSRCRSLNAGARTQLMLLAVTAYFCLSPVLRAQTSSSQAADSNQSGAATNWTATTESQGANEEPIRTVESHTQSGNRSVDKQSVERRGSDGGFEPYQDTEKETVQVDAATVRTITRTFNHNADGARALFEVTEEEKHTSAGGDSSVVRTTSGTDVNGNLQVIQRQIEDTRKTSANVSEIKTTVMLPDVNGGLAPAVKVHELREEGANGTVESKKTTLLPDGAGSWQVGEIRETTSKQEGADHSSDERVSRPDSEGKLGEISHTVSHESENSPGEARKTVDTYSVDVPGAVPDGSLHLVQRATTTQATNSSGQQVTEQKVEQSNPGDPGAGLQVTTVTINAVRPGASGGQATRTVQERDANGDFAVISVDTTKSDNLHAIQVQIEPSEKSKEK